MPAWLIWTLVPAAIGALAGGTVGFAIGDGVDGLSRAIKWGAIGGGVYVAGKALKVI